MKSINFPVFLIEYNQSRTDGWINKYVNAEDFKFLFFNKHKEVNTLEIKEKCSNYDELFQFISKNFMTPSEFLEEKLSEIHKKIQNNLEKIEKMKNKIEGIDNTSEDTMISLDTDTIKSMASEIRASKNNNNKFKQVSSENDPLTPYSPSTSFTPSNPYSSSIPMVENQENKDNNNNNNNLLPAHLNNSLYEDSNAFDKYSGSSATSAKVRFSSSSAKTTKKSNHRYHASVSNPNVQKEFWRNSFYEAERENLELCLLEKFAFSHRRLLENIIKAVEMLFKYYPDLFYNNSKDSTIITNTTNINELGSSADGTSISSNSNLNAFYESKKNFVSQIEKEIWPKLWIPKSTINICLLKLSKVYDEIRQSEKFYLEATHQKYDSYDEGHSVETENRFDDIYKQPDYNNSRSSLQTLLDHEEEGRGKGRKRGRIGEDENNDVGDNLNNFSSPKKKNVDDKSFVRKSIKYWIHPDYVTEVKAIILRHLPIYVFGGNSDLDHPKNPLISSVYYDNHDLELYHHRIHKSHLAIAFRYRWYGELNWNHQISESEYEAIQKTNKCEVFAERKTHKEDWTGENSVKERFSIDPSKINDYNRGKYVVEANDPVNRKPPYGKGSQKKEADDEDYYKKQEKLMAKVNLAREIQTTIMERQLRPTVRTIYNRTAFQLPDDQRVRVSLDTELTFVREDLKAKKGEWKRDDVGMNWPYRHLKNSEKCLFPYAVLEVKLQTQFGQEPPQWINELTTSYLVQPVPKFSKFMHGCAMLIPEKIKINPYWFYRMYETGFDLRYPLNVSTLRETTMCPVTMPWNMNTVITNFDFISPTLRRCISSRSNNIQRPTRREPKLSLANERLFLKYFKIGILVCNVSTVIYYYGNPLFGISYTFAGLIFIMFGYYIYRWREKRIQHNPSSLPLDSIPSIYTIAGALFVLFIFNLINIYSGRYSTSSPARLDHLQNNNVIDHRY